jgi:tetratricopeptide (TPR) repeat protein
MVITHRPEWPVPAFSALPNVTTLSLNRLAQNQGAGIARAIGGSSIADEIIARIVEHADGVPLFIEELTKTVLEGDAGVDESSIPTTLQASLLARLDRLGAEAKEVAQMGAVIGRDFSYALLAEVAAKGEPELESALQRLSTSELVFCAGTAPHATYTFKHALVQDAAYDSLLISRRKELHSQIVTALEGGAQGAPDEVVELLAYHAANADLPEKVLRYCLLAGEKANERSAYAEAKRFLENALETAERILDLKSTPRQKLRTLLAMRPSLGVFGDYSRLLDVLSQAEQEARGIGDQKSATLAQIQKAHVLYMCSQPEPAIEEASTALQAALVLGEPRLATSASAILGQAYFFRGDLKLAVSTVAPYADELRTTYRHSRLESTATSSVNWFANRAGAHAMLGEFSTAMEFVEEAVTIAAETEKPFDTVMAAEWQGMVFVTAGRESEAIAPLERAMSLCEKHHLLFLMPWGGRHLGVAYTRSGEARRGQEVLRGAIRKAEELGQTFGEIWGTAELAHADLETGDLESAINHAEAARERAAGVGYRWLEVLALQALAKAAEQSDDSTNAEDHWTKAIALAAKCEAKPLLAHLKSDFGNYCVRARRTDEGRRMLVEALEMYRQMGVQKWVSDAEATLSSAFS